MGLAYCVKPCSEKMTSRFVKGSDFPVSDMNALMIYVFFKNQNNQKTRVVAIDLWPLNYLTKHF